MEELTSLSTEELNKLFHKINAELTKQFLNRGSWNEQQDRIRRLSAISKEFSRRNQNIKNSHQQRNVTD